MTVRAVAVGLVLTFPAGALNPQVTQSTINQTICVKGYTATIRPAWAVTAPIKRRLIALQNAPGSTRDYELDHWIPLELGGHPDDPRQWFLEPIGLARRSDREENRLHRLVCAGRITLKAAQRAIVRFKHRYG